MHAANDLDESNFGEFSREFVEGFTATISCQSTSLAESANIVEATTAVGFIDPDVLLGSVRVYYEVGYFYCALLLVPTYLITDNNVQVNSTLDQNCSVGVLWGGTHILGSPYTIKVTGEGSIYPASPSAINLLAR